jgi:hypothetical protein
VGLVHQSAPYEIDDDNKFALQRAVMQSSAARELSG